MELVERLAKVLEKLAPYAIGTALLTFWFVINYSTLIGETLVTARKMAPAVSPELVGRILGYIDSGCLLFLQWVYSATKSGNDAQKAIATALNAKQGP